MQLSNTMLNVNNFKPNVLLFKVPQFFVDLNSEIVEISIDMIVATI